MTKHGLMVKVLATGLIVALQTFYVPVAAAPSTASLSGSILSATGETPMGGVKVHAGDPRTGAIYSSELTAADGSYAIAELPPASYELAVESDGVLYVVTTPVQLAPGQSQSVNLAVNTDTAPSPEEAEEKKKRRTATFWRNPFWAALIVLGGAFAVGAIISAATDDDPPLATNSAP
jgi:hypothetical protein